MHRLLNGQLLLFAFIIILSALLRFYQLNKFPLQLNLDEISQLYESKSIVETQKDIYGNHLPVVFPLFGVYTPGHYIYITSVFYRIFGDKEIIIRIPAALMGSLTVIAVYFFVYQLTKNWKIATTSAFVIALTPSEIFYSRKSFEYMIGHFFVYLGMGLLIKYTSFYKKSNLLSLMGMFFLGLAMYTYTAHAVLVPMIVTAFMVVYKSANKLLLIPFILIITPLIYLVFTNPDLRIRANSIFITQDPTLGDRLVQINLNNPFLNQFYTYVEIISHIFNRYLSQFDLNYLFVSGLDLTNQNLVGSGPLYLIQLPLILFGIYYLFKKRNFLNQKRFITAVILMSMIPASITFEKFSPHRSVFAFSIISIISSFGLYKFISMFRMKLLGLGVITCAFLLNIVYVAHLYIVNFPNEKSETMHYPLKQVALYIWSEYDNFEKILIDPRFGQTYPSRASGIHYYVAYYGKYPPKKFQSEYKTDDLGIYFDKFTIRDIDWRENKDQALKKTLIVVSPWAIQIDKVDKNKLIKQFNFYDGQPAYYAIKL